MIHIYNIYTCIIKNFIIEINSKLWYNVRDKQRFVLYGQLRKQNAFMRGLYDTNRATQSLVKAETYGVCEANELCLSQTDATQSLVKAETYRVCKANELATYFIAAKTCER